MDGWEDGDGKGEGEDLFIGKSAMQAEGVASRAQRKRYE